MNEADAKRAVVQNIKQRGGYARRIEDQFSVGFPDLIVETSESQPVFFIEAKIITGHVFGPTPRQYVEMSRLTVSRYAIPVLAGYSPLARKWYLHRRVEQAHVKDCYAQLPGVDFFDTLEDWYEQEKQSV